MWDYRYSVETDLPPARIWRCYADPSAWPRFDHGLDRVELDGPFAAGTRGVFVPKPGGPRGDDPMPFVLGYAEPDRGFTAEHEIPGVGTIRFTHRLTALPGG